jgi:5-methylthioribose kinase
MWCCVLLLPRTIVLAAGARATSSVSALDAAGVVAFLSARPELAVRVGPPGSEGSWAVKEVGDGNINFVYIVTVSNSGGSSSVQG